MEQGSLAGKRVIVTGGGSGIGAAAALAAAAAGAVVAVVDARPEAAAEVAAALGGGAFGLGCDVSSEAQVAEAFARAAERLGGLDGLVCSAGVVRSGFTHEFSLEQWETVIGVNLTGTFLTIRAALPYLLESSGGSVVTIGSVASLVSANTNTAAYDASKGGVLQLTRSVAMGYADRAVRANCVCPGVVETGLARNSAELHGAGAPGPASTALERTPLGRRAHADEVGSVVAFLLSDDASYMTGAAVPVDGGFTAG